ncbi:MAG: ABC transporter ATP-binding protein [Bacilli bacterium]|nr:ABC transporter ATP-binding protein [Bacilli bacterium]
MKETRAKREKNNTIVNEIIRGIRDIKLLNISRKIANIAAENLDNATKLSSKTNIYSDRIFKLVDLLKYIITFVVIMLSVLFVNKGILTVTSFLVIFMYRNNIYDMVLCITTLKKYSEEYKLSKERIFKIIDSEDFPHEESSNVQLENVKGDISFRNVSFAYNKKVVLKNINFKVKNKELVAIVGKSGSGKSTIFNLLTKAYDIPDNMIFIDGIDINELDLNTIRSNIAVVSQTPYIFNMSIKDNLKLIDDDVTMDDIKRVCHLAELDDFINGLPDKYDTIIGEGGVNLSGGERQRLAIARAILKKSPIILLDEATSALDNVTQNKIQQTINNLMEEYTVIVIAHRLSTIKGCSKIMVIDDGHVVGMGTHKKLLKSNKVYQQLYKRESEM